MRETVHDTIILEREINASITAVWNAYVGPIARAQWGVPAGEAYRLVLPPPREVYQAHQLSTSSQQPLTARHNM
ncbi:MAG: hypothetical protein L0K38_08110 [Yaniella sp.]|uniref:hypothetical protein n=1 Tax=Yaniella sp. TaxID=2773929 RepID=UPI00264A1047|nr:hypothetical protein [Yaniella sp.]MDN6457005.1 hypothetical protein [Yaniella sp.]